MLLDWLFGLCLFLFVPAMALWRASRRQSRPVSRSARYWSTIAGIGVLLLLLLAHAWRGGLGLDAFGLRFDLSASQRYLLAAAIVLVALWHLALHAALRFAASDKAMADAFAKIGDNQFIPRTVAEARLFVLFSMAVGIGSDLLYRGFLIATLAPLAGVVLAILLASLADAMSFGYDRLRDTPGNLALSLVLGIAFHLSQSLLWIMLLHLGLGLSTARIAWLAARQRGPA